MAKPEMTEEAKRRERFYGWDAAIEKMREHVNGYIDAVREGKPVLPWEKWLPDFLDVLQQYDKENDH